MFSILDSENYFKNDITVNDLYTAAITFSIILFVIGSSAVVLFPEKKKRAWIISLVNSFVTMVVGFLYLVHKVPKYPDFFSFGANTVEIFYDINNVSILICLWFGLANIFDLLFGLIFYPQQLGLLTAYVHHSVFIWIMIISTTGNGFFIKATPFASTFVFMLIEEFPTFLLALGSVFPAFRTGIINI